MERTLADLRANERAVVARVALEGASGRRLMEMGILRGAKIAVLGRAPLGDPMAIEARGARVALRASEARRVFVKGENA